MKKPWQYVLDYVRVESILRPWLRLSENCDGKQLILSLRIWVELQVILTLEEADPCCRLCPDGCLFKELGNICFECQTMLTQPDRQNHGNSQNSGKKGRHRRHIQYDSNNRFMQLQQSCGITNAHHESEFCGQEYRNTQIYITIC